MGVFQKPDRRIGGYRVACERNLLGHTRVCHFLGLVRHHDTLGLIRAEGLFLPVFVLCHSASPLRDKLNQQSS